jgi:hypothetical protein
MPRRKPPRALEAMDKNEEFIKMTPPVMMAPE